MSKKKGHGKEPMSTEPIFSLCHTTARVPDGWREALQMWRDRADHPELVEHILVADVAKFKSEEASLFMADIFSRSKCVINHGPETCVAGWNLAAESSSGKFLINVADDLFPPEHWDTLLLRMLNAQVTNKDWADVEIVLDVDTGAPDWAAAGAGGLLTFCFMTRKYYERYGYMLYPGYLTVYSDNDFTDQARKDGVVVTARHLKFEHRHPIYNPDVKTDAVYENQSRREAWDVGKKLYMERSKGRGYQVRKKLAICLPGEQFSSPWVMNWTQLFSCLMPHFDLVPNFCYSTNVYVTRATLANGVMECKPSPDYVLWIDDDNLLTFEHFMILLKDLEEHPEIDSVSAWTWVATNGYQTPARVSVGNFDKEGNCKSLDPRYMLTGHAHPGGVVKVTKDLTKVDWTGFPAVLMKYEALVRAGGHQAFQPVPVGGHPFGFYGEDTSFCWNAKKHGVRMYVDRRVKIPHLKLQGVEPIMPDVQKEAQEAVA